MNSNTFHRRAALQAMAGLIAGKAAAAESPMYLSLNSVLLNSRVQWPEFPELAASTGFPACDVMLAAAMTSGVTATRELMQRLKLKPAIIDFPVDFRHDDTAFRTTLAKLDEAAAFASAIGCPRMITYILSSSDTPKDELLPVYQQRFTESAEILAKHEVRLGLEFLGPLHIRKAKKYEFIWRMNDMLGFAKECGANVGLLLDSWHWHHAGATTHDIVSAGRDRIVHVHFNDSPNLPPDQIRDNQRLLPGEGVINLVGFLQALQKVGYRDALSVEVFGRMNQATPEGAARKGLDASNAVFRKAGIPVT